MSVGVSRSNIGQCFATDKLTVQYPKSATVWWYFGYGEGIDRNAYRSPLAAQWVEFSGEAFEMSWPVSDPSRALALLS
jgi:hypothetical protein